METLNSKTYHAAVYLRLSREDGDVAEGSRALSNSISNQKELVMDYLRSHAEIQVYSVYTDDGWSGVDFQRPEFQRMLSDIREGSVDCVVVKDDCVILELNSESPENTGLCDVSSVF